MANNMTWALSPESGGMPISKSRQPIIVHKIEEHAFKNFAGKYARLEIRFKGVFCYIDAFVEPSPPDSELLKITKETADEYMTRLRSTPRKLCRMRHYDIDRWSFGFFSYSNEKYQLAVFKSGDFFGPIIEGFHTAATVHLY